MPQASLPPDVLCKIFTCLHLLSRMRLRTVCKLWNTLLSSEQFLHVQEPVWICMQRSDRKKILWCPESGELFETASDLLLTPSWSSVPLSNILASSNGLVLGVCRDMLAVGNPLTRKWNRLPSLQKIAHFHMLSCSKLRDLSPSCATMAVDPSSGNYKISLRLPLRRTRSGLNQQGLMLFYDSTSGVWKGRRTHLGYLGWRTDGIQSRPCDDFEQIPFLDGSLISVCTSHICILDVQTGDECNLGFHQFDVMKQYADHDMDSYPRKNFNYRLGSYKGRCISIEALMSERAWEPLCRGYKVSELEYEAPTWQDYESHKFQIEAAKWKVLDTFLDPTKSLGDYKRWFFFEGDYAVAFCERGVLAYNMDKLTWHHTQLPLGVATKCKGCWVFSPSLTSPNGDTIVTHRVQPRQRKRRLDR